MKKLIYFLTILIVLQACKKDDPCNPMASIPQISLVMPHISLELLDINGINLIENGTYKASEIMVTVNDGDEYQGAYFEETKIAVFPSGENTTQIATIKLNGDIIDTLEFNVTIEKNECNSIQYSFNSAFYNGQPQQLGFADELKYYPTITIIKPDPCPQIEGKRHLSPVMQYISVELVDSEGTNLIENGTFKAYEIMVSINGGEEYNGVFYLNDTDIKVFVFGENTPQIATIKLNENTIDTLELNLTIEKNQCNSIQYLFKSAIYNGQLQEIDFSIESEYYPRITVVKE